MLSKDQTKAQSADSSRQFKFGRSERFSGDKYRGPGVGSYEPFEGMKKSFNIKFNPKL